MNTFLFLRIRDEWVTDSWSSYFDEQVKRGRRAMYNAARPWAITREKNGQIIVIASSRLTEAQTRALYAVIGRVETEAA